MDSKRKFRFNSPERVIRIRSLHPGALQIDGLSGRSYTFPRPGSELDVLESDAEDFLKREKKPGCCGGTQNPVKIFERV